MANDSDLPKPPDPALIAAYQAGVRRVNWAVVIWLAGGAVGFALDFTLGNINFPLQNTMPAVTIAVMITGIVAIGILAWAAAFCPVCSAFIKVGGNLQFCPNCGARLAPVKDSAETGK